MVVRSDWGGGGGLTTSGTLNKYLGLKPNNPGPVPSSGTPYVNPTPAAPAPAPAPRLASEPYPMQQGYGGGNIGGYPAPAPSGPIGGGSFGGGDMGGGIASAPAPRPMQYSEFTDDMAATDSTFMDQKSAYANALKKFIEDNDRQSKILDADAGTAKAGIARNRTAGLTSLGEDFASRGMVNSGLYTNEQGKASQQYQKQDDQVTTGLKNAKDDLGFRRAKYEAENGENGTNIQAARREAFARLAASQGLT